MYTETHLTPQPLPILAGWTLLGAHCLGHGSAVPCRACGACGCRRSAVEPDRQASVNRHELIATAKMTFAAERRRNPDLMISLADWTGAALRVNGEPPLTPGELTAAGVE